MQNRHLKIYIFQCNVVEAMPIYTVGLTKVQKRGICSRQEALGPNRVSLLCQDFSETWAENSFVVIVSDFYLTPIVRSPEKPVLESYSFSPSKYNFSGLSVPFL